MAGESDFPSDEKLNRIVILHDLLAAATRLHNASHPDLLRWKARTDISPAEIHRGTRHWESWERYLRTARKALMEMKPRDAMASLICAQQVAYEFDVEVAGRSACPPFPTDFPEGD